MNCMFHLSLSDNRCRGRRSTVPPPPTPSQCIDSLQTRMQHSHARSLCWTQSLCVNLSVALTTKQWSPKQSADTSPAVPVSPLRGPGTHGCIYTPAHNVSADHSVEHCDTQLTSLGRSNGPEMQDVARLAHSKSQLATRGLRSV